MSIQYIIQVSSVFESNKVGLEPILKLGEV